MDARCGYGRLFSRCELPAVAVCQYCGRGFCTQHGHRESPDGEVCVRERCVAKEADLATHTAFRERALLRNRHGLCGMEGCREDRAGQCSKCQAVFCEEHLWSGSETVRQGIARFSRPASFCEHCKQRRKLWSKL